MDLDEIMLDAEEKMEKTLSNFKKNLMTMRSGRANPAIVENIKAEYYGAPTPIKQMANIGAPEANLIVIKPFDPSAIQNIEKAILKSDIGLTPSTDGKLIRLNIPPLSEETRKQLVNRLKDASEETRVAIRNIRRDANKSADKLDKTPGVSEDAIESTKSEIQDLVKKYESTIDEFFEKKHEELMEV